MDNLFLIDEDKIYGSFSAMIEFGKRYRLLYKEQVEMIDYGDFEGTIDEYALTLGYSAPASMLFRIRFGELESLGILEVIDVKREGERRHIKKFQYKKGIDLINTLASTPLSNFTKSNAIWTAKKNVDKREECNNKRNEARKRAKAQQKEVVQN